MTLYPEASGRKHIFISQKHMLPARLTALCEGRLLTVGIPFLLNTKYLKCKKLYTMISHNSICHTISNWESVDICFILGRKEKYSLHSHYLFRFFILEQGKDVEEEPFPFSLVLSKA